MFICIIDLDIAANENPYFFMEKVKFLGLECQKSIFSKIEWTWKSYYFELVSKMLNSNNIIAWIHKMTQIGILLNFSSKELK
jgi:hypothetical protein